MTDSSIKVIHSIIVSVLRELSDEIYQRRVWVAGSSAEISSMNEATAALFDDSGLDVALEKKLPVFGEQIDQELRRLRSKLRRAVANQSQRKTEDILATDEWEEIRRISRDLLKVIAGTAGTGSG